MGVVWQKWAWSPLNFRRAPRAHFFKRTPLLKFLDPPLIFEPIPIDHIVIDTLHLSLHIGDLLINLLILDLCRQDGIEKAKVDKLD